jgi:hypothetical protein
MSIEERDMASRKHTHTARTTKPSFTVVRGDGRGGEIRFDFELGCLEALQDGHHVGFPQTESDGERLLAEHRMAVAGIRL